MLVIRNKLPLSSDVSFLLIRGGYEVLIDSNLHTFLSKFNWFLKKSAHSKYVCTRKIVKGKMIYVRMHRLILQAPSQMKVHHINHNTLDNRIDNLMLVTEREHRHFDGWHIFYRQ